METRGQPVSRLGEIARVVIDEDIPRLVIGVAGDHRIRPLFDTRHSGDELQIRDDAANRDVELMSVHEAGKRLSCFLPPCRFCEQIFILCEQHSSPLGSSGEELRVEKLGGSVFLRGQNVDPAKTEPLGHGAPDVNIGVEPNAHYAFEGRSRCLRSFFRRGDSRLRLASSSAYRSRRSISASSSGWWS